MKLRSAKASSFKNKFRGGVLAAGLLAGGLAGHSQPVFAADAVMKIGVLDEARLGEGYTKYRSEIEDLDRRAKAIQSQADARRLLSPAEGARFDDLSKRTRTKPEEDDFQGLVKIGNDRISSYTTLSGQEKLSDEDKKNFKNMQEYQVANSKIADDFEFAGLRPLRVQQEATDKKYIDNANAMVQKVAVDQKLTVLLRKEYVVWSTPTVDITDIVLKRLNEQS